MKYALDKPWNPGQILTSIQSLQAKLIRELPEPPRGNNVGSDNGKHWVKYTAKGKTTRAKTAKALEMLRILVTELGNEARVVKPLNPPSFVKTKEDERDWEEAKKAVIRQYGRIGPAGGPGGWDLVTHIYKQRLKARGKDIGE
jgi:hypothetical protein